MLEPLTHFETNVCTSANDLTEILDRIQSSYLVGMCDIAVPFVEREPVIDYVIKLGSRMQHLHLVDSNGIDETHLLPGEGKILMPELLAELKNMGMVVFPRSSEGVLALSGQSKLFQFAFMFINICGYDYQNHYRNGYKYRPRFLVNHTDQ